MAFYWLAGLYRRHGDGRRHAHLAYRKTHIQVTLRERRNHMTPIIIGGLVSLFAGLAFILAQPRSTLPPTRRSARKHKVNLLEDLGAAGIRRNDP